MRLMFLGACLLFLGTCQGYVRFTNLKCESLDEKFILFPTCRLNVIGRGVIAANVYAKLLKLPITRMVMRFNIFRKLNGYHPFLFNVSHEICHFLKNPNRKQVFYYFHRAFMSYSNLDHPCPYNHDVVVRNCSLEDKMFKMVPLPKGSYKLTLELDNGAFKWVGIVSIYLDIDVDKKD
ncbi:uncharacterized protein Dana_GF13392 [Drosophila ananassae]|uniref:MD-2-related lipid-recognition domain-containing protein n=1 Tax=Drosophila ananassae TaxID=7217 RepID=B3MCS9_DROAN|nr:uncharacterized protein LOC6496234 [Drosophila ananassae]EDV37331.1 uncharacterized protein Dana_GF13392 [Drosophila ananassae]